MAAAIATRGKAESAVAASSSALSMDAGVEKGGFTAMQRVAIEGGVLVLFLAAELGWWHVRGRHSLAPEKSEMKDGLLFLSIIMKVYLGARVGLWVAGKGFQFVHRQLAVIRAVSYLLLLVATGFAFHSLEGGKFLLSLIKQNNMLFILYNYLMSASQQAYFKGEGFFYLRILGALLVWQVLLTVSYWLLTTLLLIPASLLSLLPSSSSSSASSSSLPSFPSSSSSPGGTPRKGARTRSTTSGKQTLIGSEEEADE